MIASLTLLTFILILVQMNDVKHIKVGKSIYELHAKNHASFLYKTLVEDPNSGFTSLNQLVESFEHQYKEASPWYPSLKVVYSALHKINDEAAIKAKIQHDMLKISHLTQGPLFETPQHEAIIYTLLTSTRVVIFTPTSTGFDCYDSFQELAKIYPLSFLPHTQFIYHHTSGTISHSALGNDTFTSLSYVNPACPTLHMQLLYCGGHWTNITSHFSRNPITCRYKRLGRATRTMGIQTAKQHPHPHHDGPSQPVCDETAQIVETSPHYARVQPVPDDTTPPIPETTSPAVPPMFSTFDTEYGYSDPLIRAFQDLARPSSSCKRTFEEDPLGYDAASKQARRKTAKEDILNSYNVPDFGISPEELTTFLKQDPKGEHLFSDVLKNPTKAVLLHYLNSGFFSFQRWKEYCSIYDKSPITEKDKTDLENETQAQLLSDEELLHLLGTFLKRHSYSEEHLYSCGACGLRQFERTESPCLKYKEFHLDSQPDTSPLCYNKEETNRFLMYKKGRGGPVQLPLSSDGTLTEVEIWKAISVHSDSQDRLWHLHPELVDIHPETGKHTTLLCPDCSESVLKGERPKCSIAGGLDFGYYKRLGLTLPNLHEQLILSRTRLFFAAMKIGSNRKGQTNFNIRNMMKCHAILYPCQEAEQIAFLSNSNMHGQQGLFDVQMLKQLFSLFCIDDKDDQDQLMQQVFGSNDILGRSWVLAQWILVLQRLNQYYFDLDVSDVTTMMEKIDLAMKQVHLELSQTMQVIADPDELEFENKLGSDVCQNQIKETLDCQQTPADNTPTESPEQSIRYSYITHCEEAMKLALAKDCRLHAVSKLADLQAEEIAQLLKEAHAEPQARDSNFLTDVEADVVNQFSEDHNKLQSSVTIENIDLLSTDSESDSLFECQSLCSSSYSSMSSTVASFSHCPSPSMSILSDMSSAVGSFSTCQCLSPSTSISSTMSSAVGSFSTCAFSTSGSIAASDASLSQYSKSGSLVSSPIVMFGNEDSLPTSLHGNVSHQESNMSEGFIDDPSDHSSCDTIVQDFVWEDDQSLEIAAETTSRREGFPYNEFEKGFEHYRMLATTFPHVFMKGVSYKKPVGRLTHKERFHLLNQFTLVPSQDRRLLGFLFDMLQRIRIMDGVKAHVVSSRKSLRVIEALLTDPEARAELKKACDNPDDPASRKLLDKYLPHLKFASQNVPYSAATGARFQWYAMEMNKRYSAPNNFLTISPTTLDNPRSIRLAFATTSNHDFPATFENTPYGTSSTDFIDNLRKNSTVQSEGIINLPPGTINASARAHLGMTNPVAFVLENKLILNDILSTLIGLDPEDMAFFSRYESTSSRKTRYYKAKKGIFGHPLYAIGVTEDHSRGTLHWHISLLAGLPPYVLQRFHNLEGVCDKISNVLDSMYKSSLPENVQIGHLVKSIVLQQKVAWKVPGNVIKPISCYTSLLQDSDKSDTIRRLSEQSVASTTTKTFNEVFQEHALLTSSVGQHHTHLRTCHKGVHGATGCRFDMPCGKAETTHGTTLVPNLIPPYYKTPPSVTFKKHKYCLPCNFVKSNNSRPSVVPYTFPPQSEAKYKMIDVLDATLPNSMVFWQTASPTIQPSLLPPHPTMETDLSQIAATFHDILKDLPEFNMETCKAFHDWLLNDTTPQQIFELWSAVLELLPDANRLVPSFNPTLSWCTGSHNNASLLGALDQAKSALFYLVPYQGKSKYPLSQSLTILNATLNHLDSHKSQHPTESGQIQRTMKHFLTRALNRMNLHIEISDYEIAATLLDLPAVISSDRFAIGNPGALSSFATTMQIEDDIEDAYENFCHKLSMADRRHTHAVPDLPDMDIGDDNSTSDMRTSYRAEDILETCGPIKKITIKGDPSCPKLLVPEVSLYLQRSPELEQLSYYEFLACVKLRIGKPTQRDNPTLLHVQKHFHLLPGFAGRNDCYHVLNQKQATPLFAGHVPPHPGFRPTLRFSKQKGRSHYAKWCPYNHKLYKNWEAKAEAFARYYLALFRPHRLSTSPKRNNAWNELNAWIKSLQDDNSIISKFRLMILHQHVRGLRTQSIVKTMGREFRSRGRKLWSLLEILVYSKKDAHRSGSLSSFLSPIDEKYEKHMQECLNNLSDKATMNMLQQLNHETKQISQINLVYGDTAFSRDINIADPTTSIIDTSNAKGVSSSDILATKFSLQTIQQKLRFLKEWKPTQSTQWEDSSHWWSRTSNRNAATAKCKSIRNKLVRHDFDNSQQLELYDLYADYFLATGLRNGMPRKKPPQIVLCHGGPGVGKSVMRDSIDSAAAACHRFTFKTSFNAINAVEMGGMTTSSALRLNNNVHCHRIGTFDADMIRDLRLKGFNKDSLVIVEEVSNQAPWHLARLSAFCQEVTMEHDKPFGGVLVLLVGDLTQLGPVQATPLTNSVMDLNVDHDLRSREITPKKKKALDRPTVLPDTVSASYPYCANHPYAIGSHLFTLAKWFELSKQQRSIDPIHTGLVQSNYFGKRITLNSLRNADYKVLQPSDVESDDWINAPILVSTNRERYTLTHYKAIHVARSKNTVVFRWPTKWSNWVQSPDTDEKRSRALSDPCFYEYFVAGADGFLTENIQKELRLTNATAMKFHSLKFPKQTETRLKHILQRANPGDVITLDEPPAAVNVEILLHHSTTTPAIRKVYQNLHLPLRSSTPRQPNTSKYIVPLYECSCKPSSTPTTVRNGPDFLPSKVTLQRRFPLEPAFAITIHKSEGRTLQKVIIALSDPHASGCNFKYSQVHVAFSRVRRREDIRLLLTGNSEMEQWKSLTYLGGLTPNKSIKFFFDGHRCRSHDVNNNWDTTTWSARKANALYRLHLNTKH